jgi:hypothetical protein
MEPNGLRVNREFAETRASYSTGLARYDLGQQTGSKRLTSASLNHAESNREHPKNRMK